MGKIKILSPHTVNQIAAGEVIERPASVVKELIENSLDAGASEIHVDIEGAGKDMIRVKDDGTGMDREELSLAFKKHATSKIYDIDDLEDLTTLGFRGEALPSIASVSRVKTISKKEENLEGTLLEIHGGKEITLESVGAPGGTVIEVRDLFFNTPARRRYLKKDSTELSHISEVVTRYSLINPDVEFRLTHNGNELIFVPKASSTLENIKYIYGKDIARKMIKIKDDGDVLGVIGFTTKPEVTRASRDHIYTFVNGRFVKNGILKDAVVEGYGTLLPKKRYPISVLNLIVDRNEIDVNVHPTKIEIRFERGSEVKQDISDIVSGSLLKHDLVPEPTPQQQETEEKSEVEEDVKENMLTQQSKLGMKEERKVSTSRFKDMKVIGVIKKSYIVVETKDGMALIDQHAAHERINYERLKSEYTDKNFSQELMSPITVEVQPREAALLKANDALLSTLGLNIEPFGRTTFRLTSLPVILGELQPEDVFYSILDQLSEFKGKPLEDRREELICYMACHSSFTAGDDLSITTARYLIDKLGQTENPFTCPHGRPTIVRFEEKEMEKWFKRT